MGTYSVGKLYHLDRPHWPEGADYNFRSGKHELRLFFSSPSPAEVQAARQEGNWDFAFAKSGPALFFLYNCPGLCSWSDQPFAWHVVPEEERVLPQGPQELERAAVTVLLVDAATGILLAIRVLSFSPHFTRLWHQAIGEQAEAPWDPAAYERAIQATYRQYDSKALLKRALCKTKGGH